MSRQTNFRLVSRDVLRPPRRADRHFGSLGRGGQAERRSYWIACCRVRGVERHGRHA
jgi:hypothetical protein